MNNKEIKITILLFLGLGILFSFGAYLIGFKHEDGTKYTFTENLIFGFIASSSVIFVPIIKKFFQRK